MSMVSTEYLMVDDKVWPSGNTSGPKESPSKYQCTYVTKKVPLGDGHFSVVKECMNTMTKDRYAMKLVHKSIVMDKLQLIQREVSVLQKVSSLIRELEVVRAGKDKGDVFEGHHHVLQLFDYFETDKNIVLVTQLCEPDDLYDRTINAGHLDLDTQVQPFTACLLSALQFLHTNGIIHRDLKAENVLFRLKTKTNLIELPKDNATYDLSAHDLILADFGLALSTKVGSKEFVGTTSYLAPEILACKNSARMSGVQYNRLKPYSHAVDIWALGVLCYFMATGYMPFDCDTDAETVDCINKADYYIDEELANDPKYKAFWSFLAKCFDTDTERRPSAVELSSHAFVCPQYFPNKSPTPVSGAQNIPVLRKSQSSASLHNLRPPSRAGTTISYERSEPMNRSGSREVNLNRIRETLKKTLSMTSIKKESNFLSQTLSQVGNVSSYPQAERRNSTFILEPVPPSTALMNGCLCATPDSYSNFTTSPAISRNSSKSKIPSGINSWNESSMSTINSGPEVLSLRDVLGFNNTNKPQISTSPPSPDREKCVFELGEE